MKKMVGLCLILGLLGMLSGCASLPKMDMTKASYVKSPVYVDTLSFDKFKRPAKWESDDEWNKHVEAWQQKFRSAMVDQCSNARRLEKDAKQGMIAKPFVTNIERNYIQMLGGTDYMDVEVELYDAASMEKIGMIRYRGDSNGAGYSTLSFGGRMGACATMAGDLLGRVLDKQQKEK